MAETGYIVFYTVFFSLVALMGSFSGGIVDSEGADITAFPTFEGGFFDALSFPFELAFYFIGLQGLQVVGLSGIWSTILALILNIPMIYVIARLVRGGG